MTSTSFVASSQRGPPAIWRPWWLEIWAEGMRRDGDQVMALIRWVVTKHDMSSDAEVAVRCTVRDGLIVALTESEERTPHPAAGRL